MDNKITINDIKKILAVKPEELKIFMEGLQIILNEEHGLDEVKNEFTLQTMVDVMVHELKPNKIPQSNTFIDGKTRKPAYQRMNKQKLRKNKVRT